MSFQLPNALVHWNWCKDNERFQIIRYEVRINSKFPALKHGLNGIFNKISFEFEGRTNSDWGI